MNSDHNGYVQYGCGLSAPETWTNFDVSPTLRIQRIPLIGPFIARRRPNFPKNARYGDIVAGLPVARGSCEAVYCSHVLEHLALNDCRVALQNTFSILKPGGVFRCVLPDLEHFIRKYMQSNDADRAHRFMERANLGVVARPKNFKARLIAAYSNAKHLWMWDYPALEAELKRVGFGEIRRASFGDSTIERFRDVEEEKRWTTHLGIECRRPAN